MKALLAVTSNKSKAAEIEAITGCHAESVKLDIPEIQSLDAEEVAREKALAAFWFALCRSGRGQASSGIALEGTGTDDCCTGTPRPEGSAPRFFIV